MGPVLQWVELVWDGQDVRALAALDRRIGALARAAGCARIEMWLDGDRAATEALVALGWEELENRMSGWSCIRFTQGSTRPGYQAGST